MDKFEFISVFINELFSNSGLYQYLTYVVACFGIIIIYNVVGGWIKGRWHY